MSFTSHHGHQCYAPGIKRNVRDYMGFNADAIKLKPQQRMAKRIKHGAIINISLSVGIPEFA